MELSSRIKVFNEAFRGRMDGELIDLSLSYVNHGEDELALDTLCENLFENDIVITESEFMEAKAIGAFVGLADLEHLSELVNQ